MEVHAPHAPPDCDCYPSGHHHVCEAGHATQLIDPSKMLPLFSFGRTLEADQSRKRNSHSTITSCRLHTPPSHRQITSNEQTSQTGWLKHSTQTRSVCNSNCVSLCLSPSLLSLDRSSGSEVNKQKGYRGGPILKPCRTHSQCSLHLLVSQVG